MGYKDLHEEPFDEGTISKLEIFEDYAQEWLPTFIMQGSPVICIFDFFAGTGYDISGVPGSPIRILEKIKEQIGNIYQKGVKINLYLNEFEPNKKSQPKYELLNKACDDYLDKNKNVKNVVNVIYKNEDFATLFSELLPQIRLYPSLVYLDQNGIKFLSDKYFLELEKTKQTDFLYFVSSSYFWRFAERDEFKQHFNLDLETAKKDPYKFIHRNVLNQLREKLPISSSLKLYPFSIKKGKNIHGIIFGASHPRAVDKFLTVSWSKNSVNGQANFDIDDDSKKIQLDIFAGQKLTKMESFQTNVKEKILSGEITNNYDLYRYVLQEGHIAKHASDVLRYLKKSNFITYDSTSPLVSYENVYKLKKQLKYIIIDSFNKAV